MEFKKQVSIKHSFPVKPVKPFDIAILHWFTWLNKLDIDLFFSTPSFKVMRSKFRAIIGSDSLRDTSVFNYPFQCPDDPSG